MRAILPQTSPVQKSKKPIDSIMHAEQTIQIFSLNLKRPS